MAKPISYTIRSGVLFNTSGETYHLENEVWWNLSLRYLDLEQTIACKNLVEPIS